MGLCSPPEPKEHKPRKPKPKPRPYLGKHPHSGERYRTRPPIKVEVCDWVQLDPSIHVAQPPPGSEIEVSLKTADIWDQWNGLQNWYNPVVHEKFSCSELAVPPVVGLIGGLTPGELYSFGSVYPNCRESARAAIPFLDSGQIDDLFIKSRSKLSTVVNAEVSIVNFILELITLLEGNIRIIKRYASLYEKMQRLYAKKWNQLKNAKMDNPRRLWLCWNFAIKPFISDLKAILCSFASAQRKLEWLKAHNHSVVTLTYTRKGLDELIAYDPNEFKDGISLIGITAADPIDVNGEYVQQVRIVDLKLDYIGRSMVRLDLPDDLVDSGRGLAQMWAALNGLYNPIYVIWEAIPFSWLVDYFLSQRTRLFQTSLDVNPFNAGVTVLGYGHSFSLSCRGGYRVYVHGPSPHAHTEEQLFEYEIYSRKAGLPDSTATYFRVPGDWYHWSMISAVSLAWLKRRR